MPPNRDALLIVLPLLVCLLIMFSPGCGSNSTSTTTYGCHIGAFVGDDYTTTPAFETLIGKNLAVNLRYLTDFTAAFPSAECDAIRGYGGVPLLTWEPRLATTNTLDAIANGNYDSTITGFAQAAKDWGGLIYLRFAHEMNGNWYGWDGYHNGGSAGPAKYIAAWRHIHGIFQTAGATNVKWVWSVNNTNSPAESWNTPGAYYPGDAYVDWIGLDGYNRDGNWQTFDQVFGSIYATVTAYGKPLMISEFACGTSGGDKATWITDAFSKIKNNYPLIKIFCWFNINKECDWRVNSSSDALTAYKNALNNSYFKESKPVD